MCSSQRGYGPFRRRKRFLTTSYDRTLALRDADRSRLLIRSKPYQELFGDDFQLREGQDTKSRYENSAKGYRFATSIQGMMGEGGNIVVLDDPHNIKEAESNDVRDENVRLINLSLHTRVRSADGGILCIMQRVHERDFSASMLSDSRTVHLCLPARYDPDHPHVCREITLPSGKVLPGDRRTEKGEILFPALFSEARLSALEETLGAYGTAGQLQQTPAPREGGLFKKAWLEKRVTRESLSPSRRMVRGWDLAATKSGQASWTAGVLLSRDKHMYTVEDVVRIRGTLGEVESLILETARRDGPDVTQDLPQDPGQSGKSQVQYLNRVLVGFPMKSSPESGSKIQRAEIFASQCQHEHVRMIEGRWTNAYVDEMVSFWTGDTDQVDATSRAFARLMTHRGGVKVGVAYGSY